MPPRKQIASEEVLTDELLPKTDLPEGWKWVKLGEYVSSIKGKKPKNLSKTKTSIHTIPYVNIKAFETNVVDEYTDGEGAVLCNEGDFLMVWDGSRSGYVGRSIKGALGSTLVKLNFPQINEDYAYYYLQSKFIEINTRAKGVGIPHVDPNLLWNYDLLIPPLKTQQKIVAKIEALFTELDKGVETLKTAQQQLKVYRQVVLKAAFEGKGIIEKKMDNYADIIDPHPSHRTPPESPDGIPYIGISDIDRKTYTINISKARKVSSKILEEHKQRYTLTQGDFIIGKIGTIGYPFLLPLDEEFCLSANVVLIKPKISEIIPKYLYYLCKSNYIENQFTVGSKATTQAAFGIKKVRDLKILYCPIQQQQAIVTAIETRLSACEAIEKELTHQLANAEQLRQSILKKAFSGELVS